MVENCKIESTMLGYEDHGILTCWLFLEGDGWNAGFGGYALDDYDESKGRRVASTKGLQTIAEILNALELDSWEKLPGTFIRAETDGWGGKCTKIGHLIKDKWFSWEGFFSEGEGEQGGK